MAWSFVVSLAWVAVVALAVWMIRHRRERFSFHIYVADACANGIMAVDFGIYGPIWLAGGYGAVSVLCLWRAHVRILEVQYES